MTSYVPVLKGKDGEFSALEILSPEVKQAIMPLIDIAPVAYDFVNGRNAKTLDEHLAGIPGRLKSSCGPRPFFLHLPCSMDEESLEGGQCPLEALLNRCEALELRATPVVSTLTSNRALGAARLREVADGIGLAIRLSVEDFEEDADVEDAIVRILYLTGRSDCRDVDLIVDLGGFGGEYKRALLVARSVLSQVPRLMEWRRLILAGSSFPEDLSALSADTSTVLSRQEWTLWNALRKKPSTPTRPDWIFADYSISNPVLKDLDPRVMRMSASIRYTTEDGWLIVKGRNVRQYGFGQFNELCRILVERPEYSGAAFSWGDEFIDKCARNEAGPGNATTWRKVGVNHHITLVSQQIANLLAF